MTIGIDIDDTFTNTEEIVNEYAREYFKGEDIESILNSRIIEGRLLDFYNKYLLEMMKKYTLKDNSKEVISRLRAAGHKIVIITARGHTFPEVIETSKQFLLEQGIVVDDISFSNLDKVKACHKYNVDLMIDDSVNTLEAVYKSGIDSLLFTSARNKEQDTALKRVNTWLEIETYIGDIL